MINENISLEQARNKFLDDILDKVCDYNYDFSVDGDACDLLDDLYAIHKGRFFVFAVDAWYAEVAGWQYINNQDAFNDYVDKSKFATYQELQDFMKDKQDVNGVFYDGVKLHDFKIDEEDLKRLDGED